MTTASPPRPLDDYTDADLALTLAECGSIRKAATLLCVPRSSLTDEVKRRGIASPRPASSRRKPPAVTRESLQAALQPSNTCKVAALLDSLDADSRAVVEEALAYRPADLNATQLRDWLISTGFKDHELPSHGAITDHRNGRRPCRCHD